MDRTVATGSGYIGQYRPELAKEYESLATCPDNLLLFMHHVPYTHILHSGETLIQHIYDSHYEGANAAAQLYSDWTTLKGRIDNQRYEQILALQQYQAGHAIVWRDAVSMWFFRISGIPDAKGRVGNYPNRIEAESMRLRGYTPVDVMPWETASGGKAVICKETECAAETTFSGPTGTYRLSVEYFDFHNGASTYTLQQNRNAIARWTANNSLPTDKLNGSTSTRYLVPEALQLNPGDTLTIVGHPDGIEPAPLDYLSIVPTADASPATGAPLQQ